MPSLSRNKDLWFSQKPQSGWSPKKVQVVVKEVDGGESYELWLFVGYHNKRKFLSPKRFTGFNAEKVAKQAARKVWKDLVVT